MKLPEQPPPAVWLPGDRLDSYYEQVLLKFGIYFRTILEWQGIFDDRLFRIEWLNHSRSIMDNIRTEWGLHPLGSTASIKTTISTTNSAAAAFALHNAIRKPTSPPPKGWKAGDPLHPYYEFMLGRFEEHLKELLRENDKPLFDNSVDTCEAIREFAALIIRENRATWVSMFGS